LIDINEQISRIKKEMDKTQVDFQKNEGKLNNKNFVQNAKPEVIAEVKEKADQLYEKLNSLKLILQSFED
jgi:valyl-tRNA synthetase